MKTYSKKIKISDTKIYAKTLIYARKNSKKKYTGKIKNLQKMQDYAGWGDPKQLIARKT